MVAQTPTTPLPTLSRPDKLRLTLYFSLGQSVEALALELQDIHRDHQSRLKTNNPQPATFLEALTTENTALSPSYSGTRDTALSSPSDSASLRNSVTASLPPPPDSYDLAAWTLSDPIAPHIAYRRAEHLEHRKQNALQVLDTILNTSDSPIEKRRAATTMLRMLATQLTRNRTPSSPPPGEVPRFAGEGAPSLLPLLTLPPANRTPHRESPPTLRLLLHPRHPRPIPLLIQVHPSHLWLPTPRPPPP